MLIRLPFSWCILIRKTITWALFEINLYMCRCVGNGKMSSIIQNREVPLYRGSFIHYPMTLWLEQQQLYIIKRCLLIGACFIEVLLYMYMYYAVLCVKCVRDLLPSWIFDKHWSSLHLSYVISPFPIMISNVYILHDSQCWRELSDLLRLK